MKYILDTNVCIRFLNGRSPQVRAKLPKISVHDVVICSIVRAELFYGAAKSQNPFATLQKQEQFLRPYATLPFDDSVAAVYGQLRSQLERLGTPIGPLDLQIAAICITHNLTLVTHNTREFSRIPGLAIEDWES
jgi:tRNA(fMet)-specific endonuclease VapC